MRRSPVRPTLLAALVLAGALATPNAQTCPIDMTPLTATGQTRQEEGRTLAEYKCEKGHVYWIAVD
ncbi:hypothetical protein [Ideonella sp.]|uniref:hypothetical protein n=1 Tax=Ideonella sp. TaxID=1929293 RepID=UPI002B4992D1|nr:hypothetical protein [Ideonella sp.]HJV67653.1 hypothetical protein [Ideonella sp.]